MLRYLVGRLTYTVIVLFLASIVIFWALRISPGAPEYSIHQPVLTEAAIEKFREETGLDKPVPVQYVNFLGAVFLHGDLGTSIRSNQPISRLVEVFGKNSAILVGSAALVILALAIPLGVIAAVNRNNWIDHLLVGFASFAMGVPNFVLALLLILIVGLELDLLPISGKGGIKHLILPTVVLAAEGTAVMLRLMRASMLEQLQQDYIRTLRAKGLSRTRVIWQHALRNALLPIISLSALQVAVLIGWTFIIEIIFRWPGIGQLLVQSVIDRDYPVALIGTLLLAFAVIIANLVANIAYVLVDPRIRVGTGIGR